MLRLRLLIRGFGQIVMDVSLLNGGSTVASGQCCSFVRPPVPEVEEIDSTGVRPDSLAGRVAVLLGSSRGSGAAIKQALELRGAAVYGMARSTNAGEPHRGQRSVTRRTRRRCGGCGNGS